MLNRPTRQQLVRIPRLRETKRIPMEEKVIYLHFFLNNFHWLIVEYDGEDIFWGFSILDNNCKIAERGYISFTELQLIRDNGREVDCEINWRPRRACNIDLFNRCFTF